MDLFWGTDYEFINYKPDARLEPGRWCNSACIEILNKRLEELRKPRMSSSVVLKKLRRYARSLVHEGNEGLGRFVYMLHLIKFYFPADTAPKFLLDISLIKEMLQGGNYPMLKFAIGFNPEIATLRDSNNDNLLHLLVNSGKSESEIDTFIRYLLWNSPLKDAVRVTLLYQKNHDRKRPMKIAKEKQLFILMESVKTYLIAKDYYKE